MPRPGMPSGLRLTSKTVSSADAQVTEPASLGPPAKCGFGRGSVAAANIAGDQYSNRARVACGNDENERGGGACGASLREAIASAATHRRRKRNIPRSYATSSPKRDAAGWAFDPRLSDVKLQRLSASPSATLARRPSAKALQAPSVGPSVHLAPKLGCLPASLGRRSLGHRLDPLAITARCSVTVRSTIGQDCRAPIRPVTPRRCPAGPTLGASSHHPFGRGEVSEVCFAATSPFMACGVWPRSQPRRQSEGCRAL